MWVIVLPIHTTIPLPLRPANFVHTSFFFKSVSHDSLRRDWSLGTKDTGVEVGFECGHVDFAQPAVGGLDSGRCAFKILLNADARARS